ncbi:hypothetical protein GCM10023175_09110 [Pseudonocardia xishanensis]|uniref:Uncharacterized protein n=1 Tax=Pseudonocardia xishanensis TaxID=630995 RepID=A0ABP8RHE0_9PSEU
MVAFRMGRASTIPCRGAGRGRRGAPRVKAPRMQYAACSIRPPIDRVLRQGVSRACASVRAEGGGTDGGELLVDGAEQAGDLVVLGGCVHRVTSGSVVLAETPLPASAVSS